MQLGSKARDAKSNHPDPDRSIGQDVHMKTDEASVIARASVALAAFQSDLGDDYAGARQLLQNSRTALFFVLTPDSHKLSFIKKRCAKAKAKQHQPSATTVAPVPSSPTTPPATPVRDLEAGCLVA